jgi:hypothetical protein
MKRLILPPMIVLLLLAAPISVMAKPLHIAALAMAPNEVASVILGIVGVLLQLAVMYIPKFNDWYQNLPNKGLAMLGLVVVVGAAYFGLACTSLAAMLGIGLSCTVPDLYTLLQALFIIAMSQTVTYSYTKTTVRKKFAGE